MFVFLFLALLVYIFTQVVKCPRCKDVLGLPERGECFALACAKCCSGRKELCGFCMTDVVAAALIIFLLTAPVSLEAVC
jgi:hypothetical protein